MKNIDIKSIIIGALLTSTIFLGVAATSKDDKGKWDTKQKWDLTWAIDKDGNRAPPDCPEGWEPFAVQGPQVWFRQRDK